MCFYLRWVAFRLHENLSGIKKIVYYRKGMWKFSISQSRNSSRPEKTWQSLEKPDATDIAYGHTGSVFNQNMSKTKTNLELGRDSWLRKLFHWLRSLIVERSSCGRVSLFPATSKKERPWRNFVGFWGLKFVALRLRLHLVLSCQSGWMAGHFYSA